MCDFVQSYSCTNERQLLPIAWWRGPAFLLTGGLPWRNKVNFEFSDVSQHLRIEARKFLRKECPASRVREAMEGRQGFDAELWSAIARMGWLGAAIPDAYGGLGLGYESLCVIAEELGRANASVPMASSIYMASEFLTLFGTEAQRERMLPGTCSGERIGTFALFEGPGDPNSDSISIRYESGRLTGRKWPVADGACAHYAIVAARDEDLKLVLCLVDLSSEGVTRTILDSIDPSRQLAMVEFSRAPAEILGIEIDAWASIHVVLDRAAVLIAFEQVGGATVAMEMACEHAKSRNAFGRPIGSFQAIKHRLADMFMLVELARSNAYFGAWALSTGSEQLPAAAAAARVTATHAFQFVSRENIHVHGGMGFTWEADCHLYFRRARELTGALGPPGYWKDRLVSFWEAR